MATEEMMNIDERYKYLRIQRPRYLAAGRKEKARLLDEMETTTGLHRKHLIRLMSAEPKRRPRSKERGPRYGPEVTDALAIIWESSDYICAERLTPSLVWVAQHLEDHGELRTTPELLEQLGQISIPTVDRRLALLRQDQPRLRRPRVQGPPLTRDIPMKRLSWDIPVPGYLEADLVHHCGVSASGEYVHTLQWVDIATGWSERVALLGRSYRAMEDAFRRILRRLPFAVIEIHPDNGSEFFNAHLLRFFGEVVQGAQLSRSRPYHKNDNRIVEQKNSTLVRKYLGYDRLDTVAQTLALNELYEKMWLYYNFFQPVMHLVEKTYIPATAGRPARLQRRHDRAQTPFDRLCATGAIAPERRAQLESLRDRTNPRQLRQEIYDQVDCILDLPGATPGQAEDVFLTLEVCTISEKEAVPLGSIII